MISAERLPEHGDTVCYSEKECVDVPQIEGLPHELYEKVGHFEFPQPFVTLVKNVDLLGPVGVGVLGGTSNVILDTAYSGRMDVMERNSPYLSLAWEARKQIEPVKVEFGVSMVGVWAGNYFHWLLEFISRMEGVEAYLKEKDISEKPTVIIEGLPPSFVEITLGLLGYDYIKTGHYVAVDNLLVPTFRRHEGRVAPGAVRYLKKMFHLKGYKKLFNIYVSRENAKERRVLNRPAPLNGYGILKNEEHTFSVQVFYYSMATAITGPHGAGLTNMVWSEPGIEVTELFGSYINPCYMTLAAACGHKYTPVFCEPAGPEGKDMKARMFDGRS